MKTNRIQLMVYGENLSDLRATSRSPSLRILKTHTPSASHAFIDIQILNSAKPGSHRLQFASRLGTAEIAFPLLKREANSTRHQGFDQRDVVYLITPDRFANGDTTNDDIADMPDSVNRAEPFARHGGDLQGIANKLDYFRDLGVTALWLNPVVENNTRRASYHGYAVTDLYSIDARFGSNEQYGTLVSEAHKRGLKVILDHVNNHISIDHPWMQNLPTPDWLNGTPAKHEKPYHSKAEIHDIHSDSVARSRATLGWFSDGMPDLNQRQPFVANYLIQNTIWWIEYSGLDGIREDTYPYVDPTFSARWCSAILNEYPTLNIVAESWIQDPAYLAPYQRHNYFPKRSDPQLPALLDFGFFDASMRAFADSGKIESVFDCLAKDFLYADPTNLMTFLDNHDITRIAYRVGGDNKRLKLALMLLLTTRGIPQILYGTEIGMMGGPDHGRLRADFPGGFPGDVVNAFTAQGRTAYENDIFDFTRLLLRIRKEHPVLQTGELLHFRPVKDVYVYFRILKGERILIALNHRREHQIVSLEQYEHQLPNVVKLREILSGREFDFSTKKEIELEGMTGGVFEVVKESQ
ncbi:MAG: cyclomaltodextrinase C-terminal domain-containing protein [Ignavibacteriae bacterium]|nr:cyclomaltodextrinase C-terminal domain-containing protein [Ignavibacteriota bacterium]